MEAEGNDAVKVLFFNIVALTQSVTPNQWVEVQLPCTTFMEKCGVEYFCAINYSGKATAVRIGAITANGMVDPDSFFDPASLGASSQVSTTGNAFDAGNKATYTFVKAEDNTDEVYGGAYVAIGSTALTDKNLWGNIFIKPANNPESYASYKSIKVWIYVEGNGSDDIAWSFYGAYSQTFARNKWVQIEIPMETYIANAAKVFVGGNFSANASWGITGVRIGEIVAVK